jgi:hypothetical protein
VLNDDLLLTCGLEEVIPIVISIKNIVKSGVWLWCGLRSSFRSIFYKRNALFES